MGARMHSVDMETRQGAGNYLRSLENRIRERAYEMWTAQGCIQGHDDQHWLAAEREILTESTAPSRCPKPPLLLHAHLRRSLIGDASCGSCFSGCFLAWASLRPPRSAW